MGLYIGSSNVAGGGSVTDSSVAAFIGAGGPTDTALSATYARSAPAIFAPGRRWAFAGDSITNGSSATNFIYSYPSLAIQACGSLRVRPDSIEAGTSGHTAAMLVPEIDHIIALGAEAIHVQIGTNDAGTTAVASYQASIASIVTKIKAAGLPFTVGTVPPRGTASAGLNAASRAFVKAVNTWLRLWVPAQGGEVAETWGALNDPATGDLASAYDSSDGIHPNNLGHAKMAQVVARAMLRAMGGKTPQGMIHAKDGFSLDTDPLNVRASVTSSNHFEQPGGTGTAPTYSMVTDADTLADKSALGFFRIPSAARWAQMDFDCTAAGGTRQVGTTPLFATPAAGGGAAVAVGDTIVLAGVFQIEDVTGTWETDVVAGTALAGIRLANQSAVTIINLTNRTPGLDLGLNAAGNRVWQVGPFFVPATVPAGATGFLKYVSLTLPTGKHVKARWALDDLFDATALGVPTIAGTSLAMTNVDNP